LLHSAKLLYHDAFPFASPLSNPLRMQKERGRAVALPRCNIVP
jgi:hypothetical protein